MIPGPDDRPHVEPATTTTRLRRSWDALLERTVLLHPVDSHVALLDWQPARWPDGGGMPVEIALALGSALTSLGLVVGRTDECSRAAPHTTLIRPPRRSALQMLRDMLLRRGPAEALVCTRDPAQIALLLDTGWSVQQQAILVLSQDGPADSAIELLRYRWDWRNVHLSPPIAALAMPSNDGDGVMFATPSAGMLADLLDRVGRALITAGFPGQPPEDVPSPASAPRSAAVDEND